MVKKLSITSAPANAPVKGFVTKFGGQPVWWGEPQWPLSRSMGHPMRFIGQIALDCDLFGEISSRMAYLFMTDEEADVDGTWKPDGGENALIIQPGIYEGPTVAQRTGPTVESWIEEGGMQRLRVVEYNVVLTPGEDPDVYDEDAAGEGGSEWEAGAGPESENKVGGTPAFLQFPEHPPNGPWRLLVQLDSVSAPFSVNFGDAGVGYGFLSEDGERGAFLWQCL